MTVTLTALDKVVFHDDKEGLLGIRVAHFLESPTEKGGIFLDASGNPTKVAAAGPAGATGPQGPQGATGPQGPAGPIQPITVSTVSAQSPNDASATKDVTATCGNDTQVIAVATTGRPRPPESG